MRVGEWESQRGMLGVSSNRWLGHFTLRWSRNDQGADLPGSGSYPQHPSQASLSCRNLAHTPDRRIRNDRDHHAARHAKGSQARIYRSPRWCLDCQECEFISLSPTRGSSRLHQLMCQGPDVNGRIFELGGGFVSEVRYERNEGESFRLRHNNAT